MTQSYDVGGIRFPRPFKIRRFGHFGFNVDDLDAGLDFYGRTLGFRLTDEVRLSSLTASGTTRLEDDRFFFMTHNADHHAFLLAHRSLGVMFGDNAASREITLSQLTWQVGTLEEVVHAAEYFRERGISIRRVGRDMPGSNWHCYIRDPDGHTVEIYYGMEQIGVGGRSKPDALYYRRFTDIPPMPQMSDMAEAAEAAERGIDLDSGYLLRELDPGDRFDVSGVLLPRPFKITKIGPAGLFVSDLDKSLLFYQDIMGFTLTDIVDYRGHRCAFLRHGTEHHSLKLFPRALRAELGLSSHTTCASIGIQVGSYRQLRDAVHWLQQRNLRFIELPAELSPGIDYCAHVMDPEGHCLQIFYGMEQVGWNGQARTHSQRRAVQTPWPETLDAMEDSYVDQTFAGPLG